MGKAKDLAWLLLAIIIYGWPLFFLMIVVAVQRGR